MNLKQINEFRSAHGLAPLAGDPRKAEKKRRQNANRAERAAQSQALKANRAKGGK